MHRGDLLSVMICFVILGWFASPCFGDDGKVRVGFGLLLGTHTDVFHDQPHMTTIAFLPRVDFSLHRNWDLEFEGNFSYYGISREKNLYLLGCNSNLLFKFFQWGGGSFFITGGVGLGYNNSNWHVEEIGDSHVAGVLQGGVGIYLALGKGWWLRGEYRYQHISDPFRQDTGLDTNNFILGVLF